MAASHIVAAKQAQAAKDQAEALQKMAERMERVEAKLDRALELLAGQAQESQPGEVQPDDVPKAANKPAKAAKTTK